MRLSSDEALALARQAVALARADQAEAVVLSTESALTRFATNHIHQNVAETDTQVSVRAVVGRRQGISSTNRTDEAGLAACCAAAVESAKLSPEDPDFPGLPEPEAVEYRDRVRGATARFGADERAAAVGAIVEKSRDYDLIAAGKVQVSNYATAVANSLGVGAAMEATDISASVLSMGAEGGSGWASFVGKDAREFEPAEMGAHAAEIAQRSQDPEDLAPGEYAVVLAPDAVADLLSFLAYEAFGIKAVEEGSSFIAGHIGEKVLGQGVTIVDDALSPEAVGVTFDYEGMPKARTPIIEDGKAVQAVSDSYWSARTGLPNTGHALPAPNYVGPLPLNLELVGGDASVDELIASIDRGVYVTRFHYVNVEDPVRVLLTGMTRDGTFLIENGEFTRAVKNLRFTQSAVDALNSVLGISRERVLLGDEGITVMAPAVALARFNFTGQTR